MSRYTTLLLDADDTLLDFGAAESAAIRAVFAAHGHPADDALVARYSAINLRFWKRFERGEIPKEAIFAGRFAALFEECGMPDDPEVFARDYQEALSREHPLLPGAAETCRALSERCDLYIVTNGVARTQYRRIADAGLTRWVRGVFVSEEAGSQKPDPAYFDYVFSRIGPVDRRRVLLVGDSLTSDMQGGRNAGIDVCWYNPRRHPATLPVTYEITTLPALLALI